MCVFSSFENEGAHVSCLLNVALDAKHFFSYLYWSLEILSTWKDSILLKFLDWLCVTVPLLFVPAAINQVCLSDAADRYCEGASKWAADATMTSGILQTADACFQALGRGTTNLYFWFPCWQKKRQWQTDQTIWIDFAYNKELRAKVTDHPAWRSMEPDIDISHTSPSGKVILICTLLFCKVVTLLFNLHHAKKNKWCKLNEKVLKCGNV